MPKIVDREKRQERIAECAVDAFCEHGYSETTVQQIANRAGIAKGTIYIYFDSKSEILSHVFDDFEKNLNEVFDEILSRSDRPTTKLKELIDGLAEVTVSNRQLVQVLFDFWSYSQHQSRSDEIDLASFYRRIRQKLERLLEEGNESGDFDVDVNSTVSSVLVGFFQGQLVQWLVDPSGPSVRDVADCGFETVLEGIGSNGTG